MYHRAEGWKCVFLLALKPLVVSLNFLQALDRTRVHRFRLPGTPMGWVNDCNRDSLPIMPAFRTTGDNPGFARSGREPLGVPTPLQDFCCIPHLHQFPDSCLFVFGSRVVGFANLPANVISEICWNAWGVLIALVKPVTQVGAVHLLRETSPQFCFMGVTVGALRVV